MPAAPANPLPLSPAHEGSPVLLARRAATLLGALMAEIQGWEGIVPVSGWRSQNEQKRIYFDSLRENGEAFTRAFVARPGHSEHQTGLAIDLWAQAGGRGLSSARTSPARGVCQRFLERAADYGFVLRYPAGKEAVTGIAHEPWHFRFVGAPHAGFLAREGLVLEEYIDLLREHPVGRPLRFPSAARRFASPSWTRALSPRRSSWRRRACRWASPATTRTASS